MREPLKPWLPDDDHAIVLPWASVIVIIVLLKLALTCAVPEVMFLRSRRRRRGAAVIFAIGQQHDSPFARRWKLPHGQLEGVANIGCLPRDGRGNIIHLGSGLEGCLNRGISAKDNQPSLISLFHLPEGTLEEV